MAATPTPDDALFDEFLDDRGHETQPVQWEESYNKKQCPECGALHNADAVDCAVCGWRPQ